MVDKFEERMSMEVRRQEKVNRKQKTKINSKTEEFKRMKLLEKYIVKLLYDWDNGKFEKEYLRKLERNWHRWKTVSPEEKP